ncbi:MAG: ankyrin repeat domain-containing protein [Bryobacterales bacterium]|nr:ankyrin repeat domain-containing protein [Bryobacterales bacterium]MDE0293020.1 ankyrin repeat domain-containing protein [Bryobacterales bacterium]
MAEHADNPNAVEGVMPFMDPSDMHARVGMSPLHEATLDDSVLEINKLLEAGHDLNARDLDGATPLHWAAARNSHQAVERLIEAGADPNERDGADRTPLHLGASYGAREAIDRLLDAGADPNARDNQGDTALHKTGVSLSPESVERLLEANADPNARNLQKETPLHQAHFALYPDTVERLLKAGADPEARDSNGDTALHRATGSGARRSIDVLLKAGANPDGRNADDNTPLHRAAHMNYPDIAARLIEAGADPDPRNANGKTPLLIASHHPSAKTVELLLDAGANPDARENDLKATPLHQAATYGALDAADRLLEAGADPDARDGDGETPLHRAVGSSWTTSCTDMVKHLVEGGADPVLAESRHGRTPLNLAAELDNQYAVEPLLKGGANPHIQDHEGHTALHAAARLPNADMVERLLDGGADPHIHGVNRGDTALMQAAAHGSTESVDRLLKTGADPDARDNDGASALHHAAAASSVSTVDRLVKGGAYHQAIDNQEQTPLHVAAKADASECVNRLLKAGANMYVHDAHGRTPLELARESDSHAAVSRLEQAAAERRPRIQRFINRFRPRARNAPDVIAQGRMVKQVSDKPGPGRIEKTIPEQDQQQQLPKEKPMPQEHWSNSKSARQFTEQVATRVAKQVEEGKAPWQKGYDKASDADLQPFNPVTGKRFKGLNAIQLKSVAQEKGYNDPRWMSFQTANRVGAKIRKGERGTRVEYLRFPPKSQDKEAPAAGANGKEKEQPKISHHTYVVFNAEQIERMPSLEQQLPKEPQQHEICERAERMIQDSGVKIENPPDGHNYAKYDKDRDTVVIPDIEKFKSPEDYYGQAVKQMAGRAAGEQHTERPEPQSEAQQLDATARQDMRREMATDTICSKLHLPKQPTGERHKAQWAQTIRNSPNELRYAARDADRMADQVLQHDRLQQRSQAETSRESSIAQVTPERVQQTQRALQQQQQQPEREMAAAISR